MTIITAYSSCSLLLLSALKGGPGTNCEAAFIPLLMRLLGFTKVSGTGSSREHSLKLIWNMKRPGAMDLRVSFFQYCSVDLVAPYNIAFMLKPEAAKSKAPNLKRMAVVSSPLHDKDGKPVHDTLNDKLNKGCDALIRIVEKRKEFLDDIKTDE